MSGTMWLITEDENDYKVVKAIIQKLNISVKVNWRSPSGQTPGLSRLAAELDLLISDIRRSLTGNDCIVVIHDNDVNQPKRDTYNKIKTTCQRERISLVIANDEMEAWLLSDSGVCAWLGETNVKTWNNHPRPSDDLKKLIRDRFKQNYPRILDKVLVHLKADGINQSLKDALIQLQNAPCVSSS